MSESSAHAHQPPSGSEIAKWKKVVAEFEKPSAWRATWQLVSTLVMYFAGWTAMFHVVKNPSISLWFLLPLFLVSGGLLVRVFIIFHDCCHNSFFKSEKLNRIVGFITGVLAFTPYKHWRWEHSIHHATSGDLDRRGVGDIWTLTVDEYLKLSRKERIVYGMVRNPVILFLIAPVYLFVVRERIPSAKASPLTRRAVWFTNLGLLAMAAIGCLIFGWAFLPLQLGVIAIAATAGVWMFYIQHQFEGVYWERHEHWEYTSAALEGSSFYKLPKVLQWFTGNIGYHHVHHLSSKIPNYHLERCHKSHALFLDVKPVTMLSSLKSFGFRLWDESEKVLIGWRRMREIRRAQEEAAHATVVGS